MIIYIDKDYHCHTSDDGTMTAVEDEFFDGMCSARIEGYIYLPKGCEMTINGTTFKGKMITPWVDIRILDAYQKQYESMLTEMQDMQNALNTLGVTVDG